MISESGQGFDEVFHLELLGLDMDTDKIKARNESYLQEFFEKYDLGITLDDIDFADTKASDKITSIYINFKEWGFRLYGNKRIIIHEESDTAVKKKVKMKKVMIYNFSTRKIDKLDMEEIYQIRADFIRFVLMFNQLKKIHELEKEESMIELSEQLAQNSMLSSLS